MAGVQNFRFIRIRVRLRVKVRRRHYKFKSTLALKVLHEMGLGELGLGKMGQNRTSMLMPMQWSASFSDQTCQFYLFFSADMPRERRNNFVR